MKQQLKELVEFGSKDKDLEQTIFYSPEGNTLFVGPSVPFPVMFVPSAGISYGVYLLAERFTFHGYFPLALSFLIVFVIAKIQFKRRKETTVVDVVPYEIPPHYLTTQKKNGRKTYLIILSFGVITLILSFLFLSFGGFLVLFLAFTMWYFFILLILSGQFKKSKYLKILERSWKENGE